MNKTTEINKWNWTPPQVKSWWWCYYLSLFEQDLMEFISWPMSQFVILLLFVRLVAAETPIQEELCDIEQKHFV